MKIIDAENAVLGRLASVTAKQLLKGEEIAILNAEKAIITGDPKQIVGKYLARRRRGSPQHGPFFPRHPDTIVRRAVRGMIPYKTSRGRSAMKRLRIYIGVPEELAKEGKERVANKLIRSDFITVKEVAKVLGWHENK
jgi:large subunit ribosomal protein L13